MIKRACPTQMYHARQGEITEPMHIVAEREQVPAEVIRDEIARGRLTMPANVHHLVLKIER